ncbi:MAG: CRISPR-associated endonuclease Cas2 [Candidatus Lokiarchaeota archaeon]|nr:CRISPR-associated endonuclease Cas2 [Candidatus Harpocratesius repetitus]
MNYLVTFDIPVENTRLRTKLGEKCMDYGLFRIQLSVFWGSLEKAALQDLMFECEELIDNSPADIRFFAVCDQCLEKSYVIANNSQIRTLQAKKLSENIKLTTLSHIDVGWIEKSKDSQKKKKSKKKKSKKKESSENQENIVNQESVVNQESAINQKSDKKVEIRETTINGTEKAINETEKAIIEGLTKEQSKIAKVTAKPEPLMKEKKRGKLDNGIEKNVLELFDLSDDKVWKQFQSEFLEPSMIDENELKQGDNLKKSTDIEKLREIEKINGKIHEIKKEKEEIHKTGKEREKIHKTGKEREKIQNIEKERENIHEKGSERFDDTDSIEGGIKEEKRDNINNDILNNALSTFLRESLQDAIKFCIFSESQFDYEQTHKPEISKEMLLEKQKEKLRQDKKEDSRDLSEPADTQQTQQTQHTQHTQQLKDISGTKIEKEKENDIEQNSISENKRESFLEESDLGRILSLGDDLQQKESVPFFMTKELMKWLQTGEGNELVDESESFPIIEKDFIEKVLSESEKYVQMDKNDDEIDNIGDVNGENPKDLSETFVTLKDIMKNISLLEKKSGQKPKYHGFVDIDVLLV